MILSIPAIIGSEPSPMARPLYRQRTQNNTAGTSTSQSATFSGAPVSGNLLVLIVSAGSTLVTPSGWTRSAAGRIANQDSAIFYKTSNGTETTVSIGATGGGAFSASMVVYEYPGFTTVDQTAVAGAGGAVTTGAVGPITPTTANQLIIAVCEWGYTSPDPAPGIVNWDSGLIQDILNHKSDGSTVGDDLSIGLLYMSAAIAITATCKWTNANNALANSNLLIASFK